MLSDNSDIKCYACLELLGKIENPSHFVRENCLVECAKRNNIIAVINLLESGIDIETSDIDGMTSLCWAVQLQNVALVSYLISKGANTNVFCKANFDTPVSLACKVGNIAILHLLLQNGGDSEYRDPRGVTLLMSAAASKQPLICEYLIRRGMILGEDNFGHSALHWASSHGDPSVISLLLHHFPESINIKDLNQMTPLHYAVARGRISATQILLENGADLNLLDINGNNPCALAIQKYSEEVSKMQRSFFATLMNKLTGQKKEPQIINHYAQSTAQSVGRASHIWIIIANGFELAWGMEIRSCSSFSCI
ncbi:MAG: putative ankyrin repeat protein [Streblomastix strix]|uniref:Putative ankyrin repeat protein n=1 Tax=Streblomastix strix TaxID=222440 RepID=A0A5J4WXW1_9EUKA|nr:MAG: putative ankyrin repeat protein [Streblomastix strix]